MSIINPNEQQQQLVIPQPPTRYVVVNLENNQVVKEFPFNNVIELHRGKKDKWVITIALPDSSIELEISKAEFTIGVA